MDGFSSALVVALVTIFVAEMGDKSQLLAMAFAATFKTSQILVGITIATAVVHMVSVLIGSVLGAAIPTRAVSVVAGLAFLGFAWWTLRGDELDDSDSRLIEEAERSGRSPVVAASVAFGVSELGDKTMLATITLAAQNDVIGTWLGSTIGMVAADAVAIGVGAWLGNRLPERVVRIGASVLFVAFGAYLIAEGAFGW